jgi:hypothetical protein
MEPGTSIKCWAAAAPNRRYNRRKSIDCEIVNREHGQRRENTGDTASPKGVPGPGGKPSMAHNQPSRENLCSDWRASYGGSVTPPPSRAACSRSKRNICFSFANTGRPIKSIRRLSTACIDTLSRQKTIFNRIRTRPQALLILAHHRLQSLLIHSRSLCPSVHPTCQPIPLIG